MTNKCRSVISLLLVATVYLPSAYCQNVGLPPTNLGKNVLQPGDNVYGPKSQKLRHGSAPGSYVDGTGCKDNRPELERQQQEQQARQQPVIIIQAPPALPPPPLPDESIESIATEEPIPAPGFPPMPLALDLPVTMGFGTVEHGKWKNRRTDNAGSESSAGANGYQGEHQHYTHYTPGYWAKKKNNTGTAGSDDN